MFLRFIGMIALLFGLSGAALAQGFETVTDRPAFMDIVEGKALKRFGITLSVMPSGRIEGSAFGQKVTGDWRWDGTYFCRDLSYGQRSLGDNCQVVLLNGETLRFVADRGQGDSADLRLE